MRFNTAIAAMMEFVNGVYKWDTRPRAALEPFVLLLSPYAPHIAEELWQRLGGRQQQQEQEQQQQQRRGSLAYEPWPQHDEALLVVDTVKLPVQVRRSRPRRRRRRARAWAARPARPPAARALFGAPGGPFRH
jgi:leucyl-tRNA synthetase